MSKLRNLENLFHHQLQDIYSAETQIVDALPEFTKRASDKNLKKAFTGHLEETKQQVQRLKEIGKSLNIDLNGEKCKAMEGLVREAQSFISEDAAPNVRDAGIIADAQRIEHYEISAYGTVVEYAKALGKKDVAQKLNQSLKEESNADKKLNDLALDAINIKANV